MSDKTQERPVEPSDVERSEWPDTTRQYVEWLEAHEDNAQAALAARDERVRMEVAEELWWSVLKMAEAGTPTEGFGVVAEQNLTAIRKGESHE